MVRSRVTTLSLWIAPSVVAALSLGRPALGQSFPVFSKSNLPLGSSQDGIASADLNQDGLPDLAHVHHLAAAVRIAFGDGTGTFGAGLGLTSFATMSDPTRITTADVNLDGHLDLLVHTWDDGGPIYRIALHTAQLGSWNPAINLDIPPFEGWLGDVKAADLTGDGNVDIVATNRSLANSGIEFFGNNGSLSFTRQHVGTGAAQSLISLETVDNNGDGLLDVFACGGTSSGDASWRFGGTGIGPAAPTKAAVGAGEAIQLGDLNADGLVDLLIGRPAVSGSILTPGGFNIRPGTAGGGFGPLQQIAFLFGPMTPHFRSVRIGDLNHDGLVDLFFFDPQLGIVTSSGIPNNPPGSFPWIPFVSSAPGADATFFDFDLDGDLDAVVANANGAVATLVTQSTAVPAGTSAFGTGTPGCPGRMGISAAGTPSVGNAQFRILATHAPESSLGLLLITDLALPVGADTLAIGCLLHVDLLGSTTVIGLDSRNDDSGISAALVPIPNVSGLAGSSYAAQLIGVESATLASRCSVSPFGVVSSRGLALTIQ